MFDGSFKYGMVVVDISDLDQISYGIMALGIKHVLIFLDPKQPMHRVGEIWSEPFIELYRRRRRPPLMVEYMVEYMKKIGYRMEDELQGLAKLQEMPLIDVSALESTCSIVSLLRLSY
jgi:hypothetical protein